MKQIGIAVLIVVITLSIFVSGFYLGKNTSVSYQDFKRVEQKIDNLNHYLGVDLK